MNSKSTVLNNLWLCNTEFVDIDHRTVYAQCMDRTVMYSLQAGTLALKLFIHFKIVLSRLKGHNYGVTENEC